MEIPQKIKNINTHDPIISLLGIYTVKMKTLIRKDIGTSIFTAVLFTIGKIWKQPKCPQIHREGKCGIYTIKDYTAIKKDETMPVVTTSMDCEIL